MKVTLRTIISIGLLVAAGLLWQVPLTRAEEPVNVTSADSESSDAQRNAKKILAEQSANPSAARLIPATPAIPVVQETPVTRNPAAKIVLPPTTSKIIPVVDDSKYTLGIDDVIEVTVARHPEVSGLFMINKEGKIQFNFVGDVEIKGMTKDKVKGLLVEKLAEFIVTPDVTVKIAGYNSKIVYVIGEVGRPGKIYMRGDTISVHEALLEAGLPLLSASTRKSRLVTPAKDGKAKTRYVNVEALLYEGDLNENLVMRPGDTLYIPATIMAKAMRVISPVTQPIGEVSGTARTVAPAALAF